MSEKDQEVAPIEFSTFLKVLKNKQLQCIVFEGKESDGEAHLKVVNFKNSFGRPHSAIFTNERLEADEDGFLEVAQLIQE